MALARCETNQRPCWSLHGAGKGFLGSLAETFPGQFGSQRSLVVQLRANPEHDLAGIGLLRLLACLGAGFEIVIKAVPRSYTV